MHEQDDEDDPLEEAVGGAVMALTFIVGFGLMFAGVSFFWVVFPVGFAGVLPMSIALARLYKQRQESERPTQSESEEALEELRQRYARGELTEEEFEERVEKLLQTESVPEAKKYTDDVHARQTTDDVTQTGEREREIE